jgi:hypothetical protein
MDLRLLMRRAGVRGRGGVKDDGRRERAHLRGLHRCGEPGCDRPATEALYTGFNNHVNDYCDRHAKRALARFKAGS